MRTWVSPTWGKDPQRLYVSWNHGLDTGENYAEAVRLYLARTDWGGQWVVSMVADGAVAVCVSAVIGGE